MTKKEIKIVLVSDNHTMRKPLEYVKEAYHGYDYFFHCGDSEMPKYLLQGFAAVNGNNDWFNEYPSNLVLEIGEHCFYLTHGHRDFYFGRYDMLARKAKKLGCDVVCFGHTHIPFDQEIDGVRLLNPGSIWHNRDGSEPSYMLLTLRGSEIEVELKRYHSKKQK